MENQKTKIVLNKGYSSFALSQKAMDFLGLTTHNDVVGQYSSRGRMDPRLIYCVELMRGDASAEGASLVVEEIECGRPFRIEENLDSDEVEQIRYQDEIYWLVAQPTQPKS